MSEHSTVPGAMANQIFALLSRMHVLLRREIGHVTDIKYMSVNPEYCLYVLDLAEGVANPDLQLICNKLEALFFGVNGVFDTALSRHLPGRTRKSPVLSSRASAQPDTAAASAMPKDVIEADDQHYVGRLR